MPRSSWWTLACRHSWTRPLAGGTPSSERPTGWRRRSLHATRTGTPPTTIGPTCGRWALPHSRWPSHSLRCATCIRCVRSSSFPAIRRPGSSPRSGPRSSTDSSIRC
uniref:(northern house mosquito) hypothetical protein n=1 Tax=Culex pipiens TaxID=7175 RepID=A0A8D8CJ32_CULPI